MTPEIALILSIAVGMILLFVFELLPIEAIGLLVIVAMTVTGLVTPEEGVSGFANQAVITIMALMIIGAALEETGAVATIGFRIKDIFFLESWKTTGLLMLLVGTFSAFINTTAVVILFLSILLKLSNQIPTNLSKLLIPLSFASIMGGSCSLMGTSTNLIVSSISQNAGFEPFGFFEFTPIGVAIFAVATVYMLLIGRHLLPERVEQNQLQKDFPRKNFITPVQLNEGSKLIGKRVFQTHLFRKKKFKLLAIERNGKPPRTPDRDERLRMDDVLYIMAGVEDIKKMMDSDHVTFAAGLPEEEFMKTVDNAILCEALLKPSSSMIGSALDINDFWQHYKVIPIGIHKAQKTVDVVGRYFSPAKKLHHFFKKPSLEVGDTVLLMVDKVMLEELKNTPDFVLMREFKELHFENQKIILSLSILAGIVLLSAFNVLPIMVSALTGALAMVLTRCIALKKAFQEVNWSILFLLAGMIPLGIAMGNTGADQYMAEKFVKLLSIREPLMLIGGMFFFTALLSSILSNNATAILLAPIAISLASQLGVPPKALLFAVMFGANTSYFTPIGYQVNTLVYNPGNYKFKDFLVVGGPLTIIIGVVATFLIHYLV